MRSALDSVALDELVLPVWDSVTRVGDRRLAAPSANEFLVSPMRNDELPISTC